ncbi:hypothetical protein ABT352_33535 [Streptosporangium sp. NPDC000563]|uniref:hypothetical protein n=1 Tax=Streptosporangium sp. NPDC000563 TaxID=3154366 RepID=UPI00332F9EFD
MIEIESRKPRRVGDRLVHPAWPGYLELLTGDGTSPYDQWKAVGFGLPEPQVYTQPDFMTRLNARNLFWDDMVAA